MLYLLDTNVISELRKGSRCDAAVSVWEQKELIPHGGAISVITIGEIRKGIDLINQRDVNQAAKLEQWLHGLYQHFSHRILPITTNVAEEWGRLNAKRPLPAADSLLGATANVYSLILATRNVNDLQGVGVRVVNPFAFDMTP
ncbi:MAG: type II toxin-antitoxin system VapC family toxin [Planctomycetota bacterium]